MNIKQIEKIITKILVDGKIEPNEAKIEAKMLIKHFLNVAENDFIFDTDVADYSITEEKAKLRAETKMPIQHIIGHAHFMGEDFIVNENVLIPRDETEFLVRKAVEIIKQNNFKIALDIGTGTGCIACIVAKLTEAHVIGVDISTNALQVALDNASRMSLFNMATFRKSDIFSNINKGFMGNEFFDIIISNPPYIPPTEKANVQAEVNFDPELALYTTDKDGIEFYEKITKEAPNFLKPDGYLMFELGIGQAQLVENLMKENNFKNIEIQKDLAGIERIIWGNL